MQEELYYHQEELFYQIALTQISQIGDVIAKKLLDRFGTASAIFKAKRKDLESIGEIGSARAQAILRFNDFERVKQEMFFMERFQIQPLFYTDARYPQRLKHCVDSPVLLYYKGNADLNATRVVSIIGTRSPSDYGRQYCAKIVEELTAAHVMVVSGMAYGVDIIAHQAAIRHGLPTVGVLGHGLDRLYPSIHRPVAAQMLENGGLLTDFMSATLPDKQNFPKRNRIVAGLADATIVIESGVQGGSLITAAIANSYNRDVMAVPGKVGDPQSAGCLELIKTNRAMLVTSAGDIMEAMGWQPPVQPVRPHPQQQLFVSLNTAEQALLRLFDDPVGKGLEDVCMHTTIPGSQVATMITRLEMHHFIRSVPGQKYQIV